MDNNNKHTFLCILEIILSLVFPMLLGSIISVILDGIIVSVLGLSGDSIETLLYLVFLMVFIGPCIELQEKIIGVVSDIRIFISTKLNGRKRKRKTSSDNNKKEDILTVIIPIGFLLAIGIVKALGLPDLLKDILEGAFCISILPLSVLILIKMLY